MTSQSNASSKARLLFCNKLKRICQDRYAGFDTEYIFNNIILYAEYLVNSIQDILSYIIRCYVTVDGNIVTVKIIKAPIIMPYRLHFPWGYNGEPLVKKYYNNI